MSRVLSVLVSLLLLGTVLGGAVGGVAAQTTATPTPTATPTATPTEHVNKTVMVGNETRNLYVQADNVTADLTVEIYGIDSAGVETQTATDTILTTSSTALSEYAVNTTQYDSYRIVVSGGSAESVDVGTISAVSALGGGGILSGSGSSGVLVGGIALLLIGVLAMRED